MYMGLSRWLSGKEPACNAGCKRHRFDPWVRKIPRRRGWLPTPVLLPGKSHGQRSQVGYIPWGHKVLDTSEQPSTRTESKGGGVWEYTQTGLATCEHRLVDNC